MKIILANDHAGFNYKEAVLRWLKEKGFSVFDQGCYSTESCDYPDFIHPAASKLESNQFDFGIFFCGSANGVAITANKHRSIRAAICWNIELASLARKHNNANALCIPCRFVDLDLAVKMVDTFLLTPFEGGRHQNRVDKIAST